MMNFNSSLEHGFLVIVAFGVFRTGDEGAGIFSDPAS
jgi:hypothetical protein